MWSAVQIVLTVIAVPCPSAVVRSRRTASMRRSAVCGVSSGLGTGPLPASARAVLSYHSSSRPPVWRISLLAAGWSVAGERSAPCQSRRTALAVNRRTTTALINAATPGRGTCFVPRSARKLRKASSRRSAAEAACRASEADQDGSSQHQADLSRQPCAQGTGEFDEQQRHESTERREESEFRVPDELQGDGDDGGHDDACPARSPQRRAAVVVIAEPLEDSHLRGAPTVPGSHACAGLHFGGLAMCQLGRWWRGRH